MESKYIARDGMLTIVLYQTIFCFLLYSGAFSFCLFVCLFLFLGLLEGIKLFLLCRSFSYVDLASSLRMLLDIILTLIAYSVVFPVLVSPSKEFSPV